MDAVADQFIPDHDLELQFGVAHQLPAAGCGRLAAGDPGRGWPGRRLWLQSEVEAGGRGVLLPQPAHSLLDAAAVRGSQHPDSVQVGVPDLFTHLQVVIAVVHERLGVLRELQRLQPLVHDVGAHGGPGTPPFVARPPSASGRVAPVQGTLDLLLQRPRAMARG